MGISFKITDIDKVMAELKAGAAKYVAAAQKGFLTGMTIAEGKIAQSQMTGRPGLKRGSGNLARSGRMLYTHEVGNDIKARIIFGQPSASYGVFHDIGGKFTSKGKLFTIGTARAGNKRPSDFGDQLHFIPFKNKDGGMLVRDTVGKKGKEWRKFSEVFFICKRSIVIPRRLSISGRNSLANQLVRITVPQEMARQLKSVR